MDDVISRQDVLDIIEDLRDRMTVECYWSMVELVKALSSTQPEVLACGEGELSAQPETHEERTETHACDYINRKDAIDAHYEYCNKHPDAGFPVWSLKILEDLPSAQPERQKGEWIDYTEDGYVECPFCHSATNCDGNKDELHFCFSCGADMREDGAEQDG